MAKSAVSTGTGTFNFKTLPTLAGALALEAVYEPNRVELLVTSAIAEDYNNNGVVDAADYAVWLAYLGGPEGSLLNNADGGPIGLAQYNTWKANIGNALPPLGSAEEAAVPEPGSVILLLMGILAPFFRRRGLRRSLSGRAEHQMR